MFENTKLHIKTCKRFYIICITRSTYENSTYIIFISARMRLEYQMKNTILYYFDYKFAK